MEPDADITPAPVLWPLVIIAGVTAFIVTLPVIFAYALIAAVVAAAAAGVVGAPVLFAARQAGFRGFWRTTALGLLLGAGPTVAVQALTGQRGHFLNAFVVAAGVIGAASGAIYATLFDVDGLSGPRVRYQTITIVAAAVAALLGSIALGVR